MAASCLGGPIGRGDASAVESVLHVLRAEGGKGVRQLTVRPLRHFLPGVLLKRDEDLPGSTRQLATTRHPTISGANGCVKLRVRFS